MANRYWENRTLRQHRYFDGDTGRVIGSLYYRLADATYEAHAYTTRIGEYGDMALAYTAVEEACIVIEEETRQAALKLAARAASQADGENVA